LSLVLSLRRAGEGGQCTGHLKEPAAVTGLNPEYSR
jgi:hypothetical protein